MSYLCLEEVSYQNRLQAVSLNLPKTGLVAILGENGAGKSTLLKCLAGIYQPSSGRITARDVGDWSRLSKRALADLISYVPQHALNYWHSSVHDLIELGLLNKTWSKTQRQARLGQVVDYLSLGDLLGQSVLQLSGGERARVHLARALVADNPILLADEPISSLDPYYQLEMMHYFKNLSSSKLMILILHDLRLASQFCDAVVLMKSARVLAAGSRQMVLNSDNIAKAFALAVQLDNNQQITHFRQLTS